jgi:hypothetical protein
LSTGNEGFDIEKRPEMMLRSPEIWNDSFKRWGATRDSMFPSPESNFVWDSSVRNLIFNVRSWILRGFILSRQRRRLLAMVVDAILFEIPHPRRNFSNVLVLKTVTSISRHLTNFEIEGYLRTTIQLTCE